MILEDVMNIRILKKYLVFFISLQLFSTLYYKSYATEVDTTNIDTTITEEEIGDTTLIGGGINDFGDYYGANSKKNNIDFSTMINRKVDYSEIFGDDFDDELKANIIKYFGSLERYADILNEWYRLHINVMFKNISMERVRDIYSLFNGLVLLCRDNGNLLSRKYFKQNMRDESNTIGLVAMLECTFYPKLFELQDICRISYENGYEKGIIKNRNSNEEKEYILRALVKEPSKCKTNKDRDEFIEALGKICKSKTIDEVKETRTLVDYAFGCTNPDSYDSYISKIIDERMSKTFDFFDNLEEDKKKNNPKIHKLKDVMNVLLYSYAEIFTNYDQPQFFNDKVLDENLSNNVSLSKMCLNSCKFSPFYKKFREDVEKFAESSGYKKDVLISRDVDNFIFKYIDKNSDIPVVLIKNKNPELVFFIKKTNSASDIFKDLIYKVKNKFGEKNEEVIELVENRYGLLIHLKRSPLNNCPKDKLIDENVSNFFSSNNNVNLSKNEIILSNNLINLAPLLIEYGINKDNFFAIVYHNDLENENCKDQTRGNKYFDNILPLLNKILFDKLKNSGDVSSIIESDKPRIEEKDSEVNSKVEVRSIDDSDKNNFLVEAGNENKEAVYADSYMEFYYPLKISGKDIKAKYKDIFDISGKRFFDKYYKEYDESLKNNSDYKIGALKFSFRIDDDCCYKRGWLLDRENNMVGDECFVIKVYISDKDYEKYNNRNRVALKENILEFIKNVLKKLEKNDKTEKLYYEKFDFFNKNNSKLGKDLLFSMKTFDKSKIGKYVNSCINLLNEHFKKYILENKELSCNLEKFEGLGYDDSFINCKVNILNALNSTNSLPKEIKDLYFNKVCYGEIPEINNNFYFLNRFSEIAENLSLDQIKKFNKPITHSKYYRWGRNKILDLMELSFYKTQDPLSVLYFDIEDGHTSNRYNDYPSRPFANIDESLKYKTENGEINIFNEIVSKGPKIILFREYVEKK